MRTLIFFASVSLSATFHIKRIKMEKETRYLSNEIRAVSEPMKESRKIEGYALVFNSDSQDLGGFTERILPEALDGVIEKSDIYALLNHSSERGVLARSRYGEGSLKLSVDERGLKYEFEAPFTALGDEVLEYLRRGEISQSSFAFTVDSDNWEKQDDGTYIRTILKFKRLFDVSPVFEPAYQGTSVQCSRFAEIQEADRRALEEAKEKELKEYYERLREENKAYLEDDNK